MARSSLSLRCSSYLLRVDSTAPLHSTVILSWRPVRAATRAERNGSPALVYPLHSCKPSLNQLNSPHLKSYTFAAITDRRTSGGECGDGVWGCWVQVAALARLSSSGRYAWILASRTFGLYRTEPYVPRPSRLLQRLFLNAETMLKGFRRVFMND